MSRSVVGGDRLAAALHEIAAKLDTSDMLEVGFMEGATEADGMPVPFVAWINEFGGSITIPAHETAIHRAINIQTGEFQRSGRFVRRGQANVETTHTVPEYTVTIPPRPYFRTMIANEHGHWGDDLGKILVANDYDVPRSLDQLGESIVGALVQSIRDFKTPANAPSTIAKKGFDDPLIDSGTMVNSVTHRITK
ncbi:hypothetical protein WK40_12245 [Burkholderia cepacia]|uniref:hypothetical protein n=1 Tax=Burkholderia cepacia complex TaxID=87882 RepID=UPI00076BFACE|nr:MULTISPECIES: hypothetical protein [Burkholderia cepacia complex]KVS65720.1 hypothetical protein WK40_12245 [Burkholderia cepacia]KWO49824.1 hypothetical protein WT98_17695 [Burkholderia territorii]